MHAVILDIDGTLLDSSGADSDLYLAAIRQVLGNVTVRASWGKYEHVTDSGILEQVLRDNAMDVRSELVDSVKDCFIGSVQRYVEKRGPFPEIPGAREFVLSLSASTAHHVAYATGGWRGSALLKLTTSGFPMQGIPLASSDNNVERRLIMLHALQQLDGDVQSVTYYGDGQWDAVAARGLGWQFVPVGQKLDGLTRFQTVGA
jgi:beta-phosphoglucomutase-like phosphatase (HAD superfamily)